MAYHSSIPPKSRTTSTATDASRRRRRCRQAPASRRDGQGDDAAATQLLKDGAAKLGKEAVDKARGYAEDGKTRAGGALDEIVADDQRRRRHGR